ncbi:MAG: hypothetical protein V7L22_24400 [Nostoc sp.]|uniref:hypothetical protein n=1 Tax=Nostoc sp. TaxID=1180 RepID=UPI002FFB66D7
MSFDADTLYRLMPAVYRLRDADLGEPLKALLTVIAEQAEILEEDLAQLYDDQFIETCASWVVPYLGDLIGDRPLYNLSQASTKIGNPRAEVANTIGYRRRKGTAAVLEQLARDTTGWNARVVEFFQRLATTQYMNHIRSTPLATPDLRLWQPLEFLQTPFETTAHTADVRRIPPLRGRYNIANIGIFLWRLFPYSITRGTARTVTADGRYWFHPVGLDTPLFNPPQTETEFIHLAEPANVPEPLRRRVLHEELETRRQNLVDGLAPVPVYFGSTPVLQIFLNDQLIPPEEIAICNLADWRRSPTSKSYQPTDRKQPPQILPIQVAVDPVLGRITFPDGVVPEKVEVSYTYGFSADVGGGSYDRSSSVLPVLQRPITWQKGVTAIAPLNDPDLLATLTEAIVAWNTQPAGTVGAITLLDSRTYSETFPTITIPAGSQLLIVAADWAQVVEPSGTRRIVGQLTPVGLRPHLLGNISIQGTAAVNDPSPGECILNGLLVEGSLTVPSGNLGALQISHCTLVPSLPRSQGECIVDANPQLNVWINHSICGSLTLPDKIPKLRIDSSIVDGLGGVAIAAPTPTDLNTSTILGSSTFYSLEASNSIFTKKAIATRRQIGCVRFCVLPIDSQVPRRYRCQPNLALAQSAAALNPNPLPLAEQTAICLRLTPQFTSQRYGDPAYGQLSQRCAVEIRQGADDEAEMGVFHDLFQPQREINLQVRLDEYLRFGLEAGIFYVT